MRDDHPLDSILSITPDYLDFATSYYDESRIDLRACENSYKAKHHVEHTVGFACIFSD